MIEKNWKEKQILRSEEPGMNLITFQTEGQINVSFIIPSTLDRLTSIQFVYVETWVKRIYDEFPLSGEHVIDVGALFGETAVYFLNNGAKFVTMYEPGSTFDYIPFNMSLNDCDRTKYELVNAAVTGKSGTLRFDVNHNYGMISFEDTYAIEDGENEIPTLSLADIAVQDAILKFDTEGSEYKTFECADLGTIRKFKGIMLEFHDRGWGVLASKLEDSGFTIWVDPNEGLTIEGTKDIGSGMLYAKRVG